MDQISDLRELLKHELKDLFSAETQLINGMPKMIETAKNAELKKALAEHLKVTREQKSRLEKIQELLDIKNETKEDDGGFFANLFKSDGGEQHCKAMEGLIKEGESIMGENMEPEVMDAAIIAAAQKMEHYEIGSYGTARAHAEQMGMKEVEALLRKTLDEEYFADNLLTKIALERVNLKAETAGGASANNERGNKSNGRKILTEKKSSGNKDGGSREAKSAKHGSNGRISKLSTETTVKNSVPKKGSATNSSNRKANVASVSKKLAPKKSGAKKSAAKKSSAGNSAKGMARKAAPKKTQVNRGSVSKAVVKKSAPKKSALKKSALKKAVPKKSGVKPSARSIANNRTAAKKSAVKKSAVEKSAPKKSQAKKGSVARPAVKKTAVKKSAPKKSPAKKSGVKSTVRGGFYGRTTAKKSAPKKSAPNRTAAKKSASNKTGRRR